MNIYFVIYEMLTDGMPSEMNRCGKKEVHVLGISLYESVPHRID